MVPGAGRPAGAGGPGADWGTGGGAGEGARCGGYHFPSDANHQPGPPLTSDTPLPVSSPRRSAADPPPRSLADLQVPQRPEPIPGPVSGRWPADAPGRSRPRPRRAATAGRCSLGQDEEDPVGGAEDRRQGEHQRDPGGAAVFDDWPTDPHRVGEVDGRLGLALLQRPVEVGRGSARCAPVGRRRRNGPSPGGPERIRAGTTFRPTPSTSRVLRSRHSCRSRFPRHVGLLGACSSLTTGSPPGPI